MPAVGLMWRPTCEILPRERKTGENIDMDMEPDAEVAEWRERLAQQGLAHLFDECRRDNINEYQFVAQLERWLTNLEAKEPQADVPQTPEDALKVARDQHQERLVELQKFRQRLLEQQQRQQQAAEDLSLIHI